MILHELGIKLFQLTCSRRNSLRVVNWAKMLDFQKNARNIEGNISVELLSTETRQRIDTENERTLKNNISTNVFFLEVIFVSLNELFQQRMVDSYLKSFLEKNSRDQLMICISRDPSKSCFLISKSSLKTNDLSIYSDSVSIVKANIGWDEDGVDKKAMILMLLIH